MIPNFASIGSKFFKKILPSIAKIPLNKAPPVVIRGLKVNIKIYLAPSF
jgi:hypothetical protein